MLARVSSFLLENHFWKKKSFFFHTFLLTIEPTSSSSPSVFKKISERPVVGETLASSVVSLLIAELFLILRLKCVKVTNEVNEVQLMRKNSGS